MIKLDGSYLEGGGQIVRTALAFSTLTGIPFEVDNIRKGRKNPGLKNQHLYCIRALEQLCDARTQGAELGSEYLKYEPGKIRPKTLNIDIGTAGSITLMMQTVLLPSIFAGKMRITVKGGTDVSWSMPFDFFRQLLIPYLTDFADIDVELIRRGYYPKGGGKVDIKIRPRFQLDSSFKDMLLAIRKDVPPLDIARQGNLERISGLSHTSLLLEKAKVAERQAKEARKRLAHLDVPIDIKSEYYDTYSPGSGITLFAECAHTTLGADALGERGKPSERVAQDAAAKLIRELDSGAPVDSHMADNLIPILAIIGGAIKVSKVTSHTLTNIYTVENFLGKIFTVDKNTISVRI